MRLRAPRRARDTEDIAKAYDGYAATYDDLDGGAFATETLGLEKSRRDLTSRATGDVLELGVGTGLNLPGYDLRAGGAIRSLTAVDISGGMLNEARTRADELGFRVQTNAEFEAGRMADAEAAAAAAAMPRQAGGVRRAAVARRVALSTAIAVGSTLFCYVNFGMGLVNWLLMLAIDSVINDACLLWVALSSEDDDAVDAQEAELRTFGAASAGLQTAGVLAGSVA